MNLFHNKKAFPLNLPFLFTTIRIMNKLHQHSVNGGLDKK